MMGLWQTLRKVFGFMLISSLLMTPAQAESNQRWTLEKDHSLQWDITNDQRLPHQDHLEMSGRQVSVIVTYGVDREGELVLSRHIVWPMLRTIPNNTHASLSYEYSRTAFPEIKINHSPLKSEKPYQINFRGVLEIKSHLPGGLELTRTIFPSLHQSAVIDFCVIKNNSSTPHLVEIPDDATTHRTDAQKGVYGAYCLESKISHPATLMLKPGESIPFAVIFSGRIENEPTIKLSPADALKEREEYVASLWEKLRFECPDPVLSRMFDFAKLRAAESIYATRGGLMHAPGGGAYYAAIWANDQAEYANPFFPFLGDADGNESAINAFRHFARFMKPGEYTPVPSSIIAEGTDIWNGAGDRGDAAMIAYGASRYALASGNQSIAEELWPTIQWCLEYCARKTSDEGIIHSDCDELERRFPAGKANLCTSSLAYDALRSAVYLGKDLGKPAVEISDYAKRADYLSAAIEKHFGANIEGFDTYRYYAENTVLRAWICIPLTMGINTRKTATMEALFSPRLWTVDGLASEAGSKTFWDRSTLYALRGVIAQGGLTRAYPYWKAYSERRLLGDHVPYPVEAYPEGNQRHLSAESALYCRIITEGLFGIRPTGLHQFEFRPWLPEGWKSMALRSVHAFGQDFDIQVKSIGKQWAVTVKSGRKIQLNKSIERGETVTVCFP